MEGRLQPTIPAPSLRSIPFRKTAQISLVLTIPSSKKGPLLVRDVVNQAECEMGAGGRHVLVLELQSVFGGNLFEVGQFLYRNDVFMMMLAGEPAHAHKFLDKLVEIHLFVISYINCI